MVFVGIALAAVVAFVISALYYGAMPAAPSEQLPPSRPVVAQMFVELLRNLAVAGLVAGLFIASNGSGIQAGVLLGFSLWVLPVVLLGGSVFHEGVPVRSAVLHAVDWLLKLVAIGAILSLFT